MNILLLDLQDQGDNWVANGLRAITGDGSLRVAADVDAACRLLADAGHDCDLLILCDEDNERLLGTYSRLASAGELPPTIALLASPSLDSAIGLLRAGIDDLQMLDVGNAWQRQLPDVIAGLMRRVHERDKRLRLDAELRASQQYLSQIVDGCSVAMFVIDSEHRVTHWNEACEALTGIAAIEMVGTRNQWRAFYDHARPCMADLILDGGIDARVAEYYGSKGYRR